MGVSCNKYINSPFLVGDQPTLPKKGWGKWRRRARVLVSCAPTLLNRPTCMSESEHGVWCVILNWRPKYGWGMTIDVVCWSGTYARVRARNIYRGRVEGPVCRRGPRTTRTLSCSPPLCAVERAQCLCFKGELLSERWGKSRCGFNGGWDPAWRFPLHFGPPLDAMQCVSQTTQAKITRCIQQCTK